MAAAPALNVGVIADDLVDYSQWAAPHKALWTGAEVAKVLTAAGAAPTLLKKEDLALEGFKRFDAIVIATDHTYPERGSWGGPVSKALVEYVRGGGIYAMPAGIPHWTSKDLDTGKLEHNHWEDFFGFRGAMQAGRKPLRLTRQGTAVGLSDPAGVNAAAARTMNFPASAVLVWSSDYVPCLSVVPVGRGWLIHWGGGDNGTMDRAMRDYWISALPKVIAAARAGQIQATAPQKLLEVEGLAGKSMDDVDRETFAPGPGPLESKPTPVKLEPESTPQPEFRSVQVSLDGPWQMLGMQRGTGDARQLVFGEGWDQAVAAEVPCSVQTALFKAGRIPDPTVGFNDQKARAEVAEKEWWFRRQFDWQPGGRTRLVFDGVDYSATFWLNGVRLGEHEGPFGGPTYDVTAIVRPHNVLVVRVDPLPPDWTTVFKTNCVYGWHYVNCPPIGIWRSVRIEAVPKVEVDELFVAATDTKTGTVDAYVALSGPQDGYTGQLECRVGPANFEGKAYRFSLPVESKGQRWTHHVRFQVPEPRLWWPVDLGEQPLYRMDVRLVESGQVVDGRRTRFGIRTIRMAPLPGGPRPDRYNWTFVVNDRPTFLKGCNWATIDAFLRLDENRYRRFLTMARDEHIQIMRSWGGGLLETDLFYDLCDELGIMVWQEFPLTWQKFEVLRPAVSDEIAVLNVRRLRNHPSLALWCGGNEHQGQGPLIELLGRRCLELDGTRPYHRSDPYGGSIHNYDVYWGKQPFEANIKLVPLDNPPAVIGETGLASPCAVESTLKFLPDDERAVWPPPDGGSFVHHTPTFTPANMDHLNRQARELDRCEDLAGFTRGSQLAQALGLRLVLERMRACWPNATAMVFYKLTDVFPGCSWSTVDYYGVPKIAHWFVQDAFAPLHVCATYEALDVKPGEKLAVRFFLVDDIESLAGPVKVLARFYDARLGQFGTSQIDVNLLKPIRVQMVGKTEQLIPAENASPILMSVELKVGDRVEDRTFHWFNFRQRPGCLFELPRTTLRASRQDNELVVENTGPLPAVAVQVDSPGGSDSLLCSDGYFWLDPGETRRVALQVMPNIDGQKHDPHGLQVSAWNAEPLVIGW